MAAAGKAAAGKGTSTRRAVERPDVVTAAPSPSPDTSRPTRPSRLRVLVRLAKVIVAIVVAAGLAIAAHRAVGQWQEETAKLRQAVREVDRRIEQASAPAQRIALLRQRSALLRSLPTPANLSWSHLALAGLLYGCGLVPPAMLLRQAAASMGQLARVRIAIAAQLLGHAGKYVPGKAMVVVLRVGALARDGVKPLPAAVSVFMETLMMMAVGAALAGLVIAWLPVPAWMIAAAVVVGVGASIPTLPFVLRRVTERVIGRDRAAELADAPPAASRHRWSLFLAGWGWSLLSWLLIGGSFTLLLIAIPSTDDLPPPATLYAVALAAIALAMVVGFASLLPGGVGARELVLASVLAPAVGTGHALLGAIGARLLFLVVESCLAGLAWWWLRGQSPQEER